MSDFGNLAAELRRSTIMANPRRLCERLGLLEGATRQAGDGVLIRCPVHSERTPSCSVTRGPDGTTRCRCHACDWTGDALTLVGVVTGRTVFRDILDEACDLVGMPRASDGVAHEPAMPRRGGTQERVSVEPSTLPSYPPEIGAFWGTLSGVTKSPAACSMLRGRAIDPDAVQARDLARVILEQRLPRWASYQGSPWSVTGHVLVLPVWDSEGVMQSVRAWRVIPGDSPKRLPPGGHRATGLVLANAAGRAVLRGESGPCRIVVVEGEPDHLTLSTRTDDAVLGVLSGAWTPEHAARVPLGSTVVIRTHCDKAGDKYADNLVKTLRGRGQIRRLVA